MSRRQRQSVGRSLLNFAPDAVRLRAEGPRANRPTLEYRLTFLDQDGQTILTEYKETQTAATYGDPGAIVAAGFAPQGAE